MLRCQQISLSIISGSSKNISSPICRMNQLKT
jgi:hypothetical protein